MQNRTNPIRNTLIILAVAGLLSPHTQAHAETGTEDRLKAMELRLNRLESENRALKDQINQTELKVEATGT